MSSRVCAGQQFQLWKFMAGAGQAGMTFLIHITVPSACLALVTAAGRYWARRRGDKSVCFTQDYTAPSHPYAIIGIAVCRSTLTNCWF